MGHIVADFIDTGILTADIIKTGILESKNGKSWLDMSTGEFNFGDKVKYENGKFEIIVESSDGGNTSLGDELSNMNNKIDSITNAPTLELTGEQAFLYENNFTGTPTPPSIKISAKVENVVNPTYQWYFRRSGETSWTPISNNNYNYYNVFHNNSTIFNNPNVKNVTFKCVVGNVYDEFTIVKVSSGANGAIGNDGISITEIQEQYYLSTSQQSLVGGTWQTTAPTWVKGKYIWTRTKFTYSNGSVTTTSPICVTGKDGDNGIEGTSVSNVDVFYYQSTSATSLQGGSWQTTAPTWTNGKYVWSKTITYLDNGTQIESNPICITGERGQNGIDGINGTNGKDGISTYFFIRYSEFSDGSNMTSTPNAKTKYMGTATTTNNVAPTTPSSYTWTLVKGADGKDGEKGIAGANGSSSYLHIKYSNDGRTFTANNGEELGTWIGTYVDTNPMDSSVFSDYNWVRFVGEDGADAYTVLLSNENHTFPSTYEGNIENAITTTTVAIAYKGKTSITPTIGTLPTVTGLSLSKSGNTVTIVANKGTSLANTGTFRIPVIVDGITFEKTFSWTKSKNGLTGADGEDGYTVFLTNENFTFVADDTGNITKSQSTTTNILAYKGSKSLSFTIGTLPTVNGLTLSKTTDTITIKANTGTSLADVGSFDIIINADGKSFTKKFSWSKTKTGASGSSAEYVTVTGEQVFKYTNNFSDTPTPSSITLTATKFNTTATGKWQYKNASGTWTDCTSNGNPVTALTLNISPTSYLLSSEKQMSVRYIVGSLYDEISIVKVSDGAKGDTGATGSSGIGINSITEYYAISSSNTTAPTSWSTTVPTMTATNKYLWNYETITYSNNTTTNTSKRVIGVYGDKGNTGATGSTGATGNGISKIANYYLATSSSSGVTTSTSGWTTSVQVVSASKKYLWNYEVVTYTNGSTSTTTPCIIGTYGDKGDKGDNAKNVTLTATSQVFKSTDGGKNFAPDSITIKPTYQNVSHSKWQHSLDGGKTWVDTGTNTNGVTIDGNGFTISKTSTLFTDKVTSIVVKDVTNDSSVYDTITITRLYDVTGIEVGGRNYVRDYKFQRQDIWKKNVGSVITIDNDNGWVVLNESTSNPYVYQFFDVSTFKVGEPLTLQYEIKCEGVSANTATNSMLVRTVLTGYTSDKTFINDKVNFGSHENDVTNLTEWTKCTFTKNLPTDFADIGFFAIRLYARNFRGKVYFRNIKLEKGNVATDLSPSPEDAELNIDDVKNNLSNFQTTVNTTFKDGIIEQAEAKAIARHIQTLDTEKADVDKEYSTIYNNSALSGTAKTNLASAKTEFDNAHTSLKSTINTVIADGKVTSSEKTSVDSTFSTYNSILGTYKQRVQEALDYISTTKITDVQVGGTNLAIGTNQGSARWGWGLQQGDKIISSEIIDGINCVKLEKGTATPHSGWNYVSYSKFARDKITPNTTYTASFEIKSNKTFDVGGIDLKYSDSTNTLITSSKAVKKSVKANSDWTKIIFELKTKDVLPSATGQCIYITGISATNGNIHYIRNLQLEKGNKATDWSPAVEDLENAYTIVLTNEAQVIPTNNSRVPTSSTTYYTDIIVYQGTTQRTDYTIGTINGANGITVSKTSSRVNFAVSTSTALTADGGNFTIPITIDGKTFNKTFSWSCSKQGSTGNTGNGINTITEYYAVSSSNTTAPTSWSTTVPTMTSTNKYLWNYEVIKYTDNTTKETAKRVIGVYGDKGATGSTGATGATGNGISKITNYYLASSSSSGVTTSTSGWTTSVQSVSSSKKYLWNYEVVTYTNGSTTTTTPCIIGAYGDTGDGAKTVSLTSSSQVFKSTDGGLTFTPDNIVITPSYQNVSYSKWQYSTNGGSSWTDVSSSTNGVTYSSTSLTLSKSSTLFTDKITSISFKILTNDSSITDTITIVKLYDVTDLSLTASNRVKGSIKPSETWTFTSGSNRTWTPYVIYGDVRNQKVIIAFDYVAKNIVKDSGAKAQFQSHHLKPNDTDMWSPSFDFDLPVGNSEGTVISPPVSFGDVKANTTPSFRLRFDNIGGQFSISKARVYVGTKDVGWLPAPEDLENSYTIILTNEAQVIPTNSTRIPTSNATYTTDIQVYQGTTQRTDYTIGTINSANGITVSKTSSRVSFAVSTSTAITADGGSFTIPITIDGKTFNKTFSWSCSKQGNTGNDAYTVILTNESHTFPTQNDGSISSAISTTTQVLAYKGATSITPTIGTLPTVTGLTLSTNGKTTITIQANTGITLADSGSFNIPVTVDGKSFTKTFSWSKSKKGDTGSKGDGAKSVDIISSSQVFKSTDGGATFFPNTITLTPSLQNVTFSKWQYSTNGGSSWSNVSSGSNGLTVSSNNLQISKSSSLFTSTNTTVVFKVITNDSAIYDTMTIVKLYDVTDIEIGGRNYIKNGKGDMKAGFFKNFNDVTGTYGELTLTSQKTFSNISIADGFVLKCRDYEVGRKMVFSYDIMYTKWDFPSGTNRQEFWIGQRYTNSSTSTDGQWQSVTKHDLPVVGENGCKLNEWYHVSKIITIPKQAEATIGTASSIQFYNSNADVSASFTARFKNVKLEYGNVETDWTPSPEDIDYDINTAINPLIKTDEQLTKRLDNAFSDDVITAYEKIQIASDLKEIDAQYDDMTKTVKSYNDSSITGIYNEYKVAYNNLHTALDACLKNMDTDTKLSNSVVKDAFLLYGTYYSHLRSAIDDYIKNSFDITKSSITSLSNSVDIAISKSSSNEQNLNTIAKHMKFSDEGWLELFATTNGNEGRFKTKITDTKLSFTDNNQEVAYMSNQKLYINYAQINNDLQIGSIVATKSDKGGIVFKWQ